MSGSTTDICNLNKRVSVVLIQPGNFDVLHARIPPEEGDYNK